MAIHRVYLDARLISPPRPGELLEIGGDEARHALAVKRLVAGDGVELLDGRGMIASGVVENEGGGRGGRGAVLRVRVVAVEVAKPMRPRVSVWSAAPKGDRLAGMIEQLAQVGAHSWGMLETSRGVVTPREAKIDRLRRVAAESAKQCGRAFELVIHEAPMTIAGVISAGPKGTVMVADAGGGGVDAALGAAVRGGADEVALVVGPEGGLTSEELAALDGGGAARVSLGPYILRIETAAVVGAAVLVAEVMSGSKDRAR